MREVIAYEDVYHPALSFLKYGSIKWAGEYPIPITAWESYTHKLLGEASDIRRGDDGEITAEIQWFDEDYKTAVEDGLMALTLWCNDLDAEHIENTMVVQSAMLRKIYPTIGVPWCKSWYDGYPGIPTDLVR